MAEVVKVTLDKKQETKIRRGYPLISEGTVTSWQKVGAEGTLLDLHDQGGAFVARGYYGRQNKGFGWVLSNEQRPIDSRFFTNKLKKAIELRETFAKSDTTNAYRVFNGEGDGIGGLTIDYLDGHYLLTWYSEGIYTFKEVILEALTQLVNYKSIYQKKRFDAKGRYMDEDDYVLGERPEFPIIVLENNVKFAVYLNDGPMIGFFLDQKDVRQTLRSSYVEGKRVLNTFSYTGAFSVYAALGGAKKTTSVDLANRSRPRTKELFDINGIDPESQNIIVEDVFKYFKYAVRKGLKFDVVILDPPSFARSKKHTFSVYKDYTALLEDAIAITEKGGIILASTNYSNADMKWFKGCVDKAFSRKKSKYTIVDSYSLPKDFHVNPAFPEGDYLKVLFIKKL